MAISTTVALIISLTITVVTTVAKMLLAPKPKAPEPTQTPKPADGKYNFKQNVPSLAIVLGEVKKGGDYLFLEERNGGAYHHMAWAGHRIDGFTKHYLHDEEVAFMGDGIAGAVVSPSHFFNGGFSFVTIDWRLGLNAETAIAMLLSNFGDIWTADHRGDGLAQLFMYCSSANQEQFGNIFPQGMPVHTAIGRGALVFDPREPGHDINDPSTWTFSKNLALLRLHHLTHPVGGKQALANMYLPEWAVAADVCDELVTNRLGDTEPRYHGGLWFKAENDQVEIGRKLDEAGELVVYERTDGLIGVHAGRMVTPDIRITADDIKEFHYDANRRAAQTVLAVRGRFTDPAVAFNTVDAAIYGDPYTGEDDTQRTKTVDNHAVQSHNHIQRMQALAYIRANAPRVAVTIDYVPGSLTRKVGERRFVTVDYPSRGLDDGTVELIGRPKLSLANLTISFEGIVVPSTLYAFDAATEEGIPGGQVEAIVPGGVPVPTGFAVAIGAEVLAGGQGAGFAMGSWDFLSNALTYELEYQLDDLSEPPRSVMSKPGNLEVRTTHLKDGADYRFRLRTLSNGATSDWTAYETATATADPTPPGLPTNFNSSKTGSNVTLTWDNPNSPNLYRVDILRGSTASFGSASVIGAYYGGVGESRSYTDFGLAAGTYYWWIRSTNASPGGEASPVGPRTHTI